MDRPETRFAWNGENALAYQVLGDSDSDLLHLQGWISNVELNWDHPPSAFRLPRHRLRSDLPS